MTEDRETYITVGVGQHQMWAAQFFQFNQPRRWLSSSGLGTMGFGLPAAMGVQAAHPGALVVDIDGDGSFQMNIQELATLFCEKLPVKVLLLNNSIWAWWFNGKTDLWVAIERHTYLGPIDHEEARGIGVMISMPMCTNAIQISLELPRVTAAVQPLSARNAICAEPWKR